MRRDEIMGRVAPTGRVLALLGLALLGPCLFGGCDDDPSSTADGAADSAPGDAGAAFDVGLDVGQDVGPEADAGPGPDDAAADAGGEDAGGEADGSPDPEPSPTENVLLIIADDLGIDHADCYPEADGVIAPTPTIRGLCERGLVFEAAWAQPVCSPTRAATLSGLYPFRTGVYGVVSQQVPGLADDVLALPRALREGGSPMATGLFGKWHLAGVDNDEVNHPNDAGFDHYAGFTSGVVQDYFQWRRNVNGRVARSQTYTTTAFVDDALDWITARDGPWFAMVAFNAPHTPLHLPPAGLHGQADLDGSDADIAARPADYYRAAISAMDTEMGRLLAGIDPAVLARTTIIYFGDNGSPAESVQTPYAAHQRKDTLYEGGVRVPLIVAGAAVRDGGRRVSHLVDMTDIFPTILELGGAVRPPSDGVSLVPYLSDPAAAARRPWIFAQRAASNRQPTIGSAARDDAYKLIREDDGSALFYHLAVDPFEGEDLLPGGLSPAEQLRYDALDGIIDAVLASDPR